MTKLVKRTRKGRAAVQEPYRCAACRRPEGDCSADPCEAVIADRGAVAVDVAINTATWTLAEVVYDTLVEVPHDARIMAALAMLPEVSF
jgi:hypothetical protein